MYKAKFYRENDYGIDSATPITNPYNLGNYPFGQLISEYIIDEITISRSIKETTTFNFSIPLNEVFVSFPIAQSEFVLCVIEKDGVLLVEGFVSDWEKNDDVIDVNCEDLMLLTSYNRAVPFAIFSDMQLVSILYKIIYNLDYRKNHGRIRNVLGDFYSLENPTQVIDLDLREETDAYAQASKALELLPDVNLRYGGIKELHSGPLKIDGWVRTFDLGKFDYKHQFVYNDINIDAITIKKETEVPVLLIEPYGSEYKDSLGNTQVLNISHLALHPNYPAILDPNYVVELINTNAKYGVRDLIKSNNYETLSVPYKRKIGYYNIAPKVLENPSNGQLGKAAYALYKAVIKDLKNEKVQEIEIQLDSTVFPEEVMPGNKIIVNYNYNATRYNVLLNAKEIDPIEQFMISGEFYIVDYEITYGEKENTISYTLNQSGEYKYVNPEKVRREFNKATRKNPNFSTPFTPSDAWAYHEFNLTGASNTTSFDGYDGKEFTIDTTLGNFGGLEVTYLPDSSDPMNNIFWCDNRHDLVFELTNNVVEYGDTFTVKVHPKGRNWLATDKATIKILIQYETV